jgi:hypothetical protein
LQLIDFACCGQTDPNDALAALQTWRIRLKSSPAAGCGAASRPALDQWCVRKRSLQQRLLSTLH